MAFEKLKLFSKLEFDIASAGGSVTVLTDMPGSTMSARGVFTVPAGSRHNVPFRLPYNTQGHLIKLLFVPSGITAIYGARVWARELPGGQWGWYAIPVIETPVEFSPMALPIPQTPEAWSSAALPIPGTPDQWGTAALPIKPTPPVPEWVELEPDK